MHLQHMELAKRIGAVDPLAPKVRFSLMIEESLKVVHEEMIASDLDIGLLPCGCYWTGSFQPLRALLSGSISQKLRSLGPYLQPFAYHRVVFAIDVRLILKNSMYA